ncbi:hypothetical protein [Massilia sp. Mn16-1_5]|uniref:hypothetical protein n=1 Tax=Massilia sp. Mn16-1_5 TaxID=2079199 RepID=UPI00109E7BDC|nr:hypothetical protein [Massilia sp. Mn16-1_5]THC39983.1 hypothetical protein C2862_22510 [Massilia sp. Mn16-1_5]
MNVALPTLILFVILLPGFIFRSGLKRAERTSVDFSPFGRVVAEAVLWAILLHLAWLTGAHLFFSREFEPIVLMNLLSSVPVSQAAAAQQVAVEFRPIATYCISLLIASYLVPMVVRSKISAFRLDREGAPLSTVFRFHDAPWYYLLTGADFTEDEQPDLIFISAIVEVAKEAVLYVGILDDFYFDSEGQLDRLILQGVLRRPLSRDKSTEPGADEEGKERFYPIDGDNFVLRYSEAITLNVQYVKLTAADADILSQNAASSAH